MDVYSKYTVALFSVIYLDQLFVSFGHHCSGKNDSCDIVFH